MISDNKLVSTIIPVYNRFDLSDEAVASVYRQTYRPIELIIVDDSSETPYIPKVSSTQDFTVKLIRHEQNLGPGASRESGRLAATGDYTAYLDSDDLWHPLKLEKQIEALQKNPQAGMCYSIAIEFENLPLTGSEPIRKKSDQFFSDFLPTILYGRPWPTGTCLWTRSAIEKIGPWWNGWNWEDYEYDFKAGCQDIKICYVPEPLCFVRKNHGEAQLSKVDEQKALVHRYYSVISMVNTLMNSKKSSDRKFRNLFSDTILRPLFFKLYALGEEDLAKNVCDLIVNNSMAFTKLGLISRVAEILFSCKASALRDKVLSFLIIHLT